MYDVDAIRQAHPLAEAIAGAGVELRQAGKRLVGRCPFHDDRRPSLTVYPADGSYFCFSCGAGGDVIDFIGRFHQIGFKEAAALLASREAAPAMRKVVPFRRSTDQDGPTQLEAEVIKAAAALYAGQLWRSRRAVAYLGERGVEEPTARCLRLGYAAGGLAEHLRDQRLSIPAARRIGLLVGDRDALGGRIIVSEVAAGRATWLVGRSIDGRGPRYLNLRLPAPLLGSARLRGDEAIVVEGPFDWLTLIGWGLPAVALLGTHASRTALERLRRFPRVHLALDSDGPGRAAASQLAHELGKTAAVVELPTGIHDPGDLARRPDGRDVFLRCLEQASQRGGWTWNNVAPQMPRAA